MEQEGVVAGAAVTPTRFASATYYQELKVWDLRTEECLSVVHLDENHVSVQLTDTLVAVGLHSGDILLLSHEGELGSVLFGHEMIVGGLATQGPNILVSGSHDNTVKRWDLRTGALIETFEVNNAVIQVRATRRHIAAFLIDNTVVLWRDSLRIGAVHAQRAFFPDWALSDQLLAVPVDGQILLWSVDTLQPLETLHCFKRGAPIVTIDPVKGIILFYSTTERITAMDPHTNKRLYQFPYIRDVRAITCTDTRLFVETRAGNRVGMSIFRRNPLRMYYILAFTLARTRLPKLPAELLFQIVDLMLNFIPTP